MILPNAEQEIILFHFMENVWLKRFSTNKKDRMQMVNVCIKLEDGTLAGVGFLYYYDGVYYLKGKAVGTVDDAVFLSYIEKLTGINKSKDRSGVVKSSSVKPDVPIDKICEEYKNTNSIKKTAKNVGLSEEKTKKILITAGLYTSEKYKEINELLEQGKTIEEIAEHLKMSQKQIRVFLPYTEYS